MAYVKFYELFLNELFLTIFTFRKFLKFQAGAYAQARGKFQLVRITRGDVEAAYNVCYLLINKQINKRLI